MASYYAYMLESVQTVTTGFEESWRNQDMEDFSELYAEDSALVVDGDFRVRGREAVVARLRELWSQRWGVRLSIVDFEASGEMAMIYGQLGDAPGKHITMMKRYGGDWRIARQFLVGVVLEDDPGS